MFTRQRPPQSQPIYKVSASLVNSWLFFKKFPNKENLESFHNMVKGIFIDNEDTLKGKRYEQEVKDGKHGQMSELAKGRSWQTWGTALYVTFPKESFSIRLSGKADILEVDQSIVYDIKRTGKWYPYRYDDKNTCQHHFYFKIFPKAKKFFYLTAIGKGEEVEDIKVTQKIRPSEDTLNRLVIDYIKGVLTFIKENDMWEDFIKYQQYKGAY